MSVSDQLNRIKGASGSPSPGASPNASQPNWASSGLAKFAAPMIGGIAGAGPGAMAGAAAGSVFPGPGTVIGGVLGGMLGAGLGGGGAEAGRQLLAGEQLNPQEIGNTALWTGATEPIGLALGPGIRGVRALGGAKGFAAAGKEFMSGVSANAEKMIGAKMAESSAEAAARMAAASDNAAATYHDVMQAAAAKHGELVDLAEAGKQAVQSKLDASLTNLQSRVATRANQVLGDFGHKIEAMKPGAMAHVIAGKTARQVEAELSKSSAKIGELVSTVNTQASMRDLLTPAVGIARQLQAVGSPAGHTIERLAERFGNSIKGPLTPQRVLAIKRMAQDASARLYEQAASRRLGGQFGKRATAKSGAANFYEQVAKASQQWLENNVPGIAEENLNNRGLQGAKEILAKAGPRLTKMSETASRMTEAMMKRAEARTAEIDARLSRQMAKHEANVGRGISENYGRVADEHASIAAGHAAAAAESEASLLAGRAERAASRKRGIARAGTMVASQAIPGSHMPLRAAELAGGYALGQLAEPITTPLAMQILKLLGNPATQAVLQQTPRAVAVGATRQP